MVPFDSGRGALPIEMKKKRSERRKVLKKTGKNGRGRRRTTKNTNDALVPRSVTQLTKGGGALFGARQKKKGPTVCKFKSKEGSRVKGQAGNEENLWKRRENAVSGANRFELNCGPRSSGSQMGRKE